MTNFWKHASTDQKLAQIDGAIELHMSSRQCGMNVGADAATVRSFARKRGRHFDAPRGRKPRFVIQEPVVKKRARHLIDLYESYNLENEDD